MNIKYLVLELENLFSFMDGKVDEEDYKEMVCILEYFKIRFSNGFGRGCDN